jgi:hypothetical protein
MLARTTFSSVLCCHPAHKCLGFVSSARTTLGCRRLFNAEQSGSVLSDAKAKAVFHGPPSSVELCRDRDGTLDATVRQLQFRLHALHD